MIGQTLCRLWGLNPRTSFTLGGCLTYCAIRHKALGFKPQSMHNVRPIIARVDQICQISHSSRSISFFINISPSLNSIFSTNFDIYKYIVFLHFPSWDKNRYSQKSDFFFLESFFLIIKFCSDIFEIIFFQSMIILFYCKL